MTGVGSEIADSPAQKATAGIARAHISANFKTLLLAVIVISFLVFLLS